MLAKIREKTQGIIATLILCFLAIPFILWGIGSYFDKGPSTVVAKVNGIEIGQQAYRQRLDELRGTDPSRADNPVIKEMIVESLIEQTLLVSRAEAEGYRMSDMRLANIIHDIPNFQRAGKFDPGLYQALLRQQGMGPTDFESRLRRDNMTTQLQQGLRDTAFVTDADMAAVLRLLKQGRRISFAVLNPETFLPKVSVSPQEIEARYQANQDAYRSPEAVRIEYVTLKASDVGEQVQPTEEELRQAYNADAARYVTPEKRRVSHILVTAPAGAAEDVQKAAQTRIEDIAKQIRQGADFAAVAKKQSDDKESAAKGGDLGEVAPGVLPAELDAAAKTLKVNEVSQPVRTRYGYHLVKLTALKPEQRRSFEAAKSELVQQIRRRKGEERFFELGERLRNLVYEHPEGLQVAAKELGLTVQTNDWFTRAGGPGLASQPRVVSAAFEPDVLSRQRNSDVIELNAETLLALHVTEHRPSVVRPLEEVRPSIERALKEERAREQARTQAVEWTKKIEQGTKLGELARAANVSVQTGKTVTRENANGVDKRIVDAAFAAARPKESPVSGQVDLATQGFAVYVLEAVNEVDPATADAAAKEKAKRQLIQRRGADYYADYRIGLRKSASVKINTDQL